METLLKEKRKFKMPSSNNDALPQYTMDDIRAMIEQSKSESAAGLGIDSEIMFNQLRKEFAEEKHQHELAEAV